MFAIAHSFHPHLFQFESHATGDLITRVVDKDDDKETKKTELSYEYKGKYKYCKMKVSEWDLF